MRKLTIFCYLLFISYSTFSQSFYDKIDSFGVYRPNWATVYKNNKMGFIDKNGKEIVAPIYDLILDYSDFKKGWAMVKRGSLYGFIDSLGKSVVPPIYQRIDYFDEYNLGWAKIQKNGKYGFIDSVGYEIVKPNYDKINAFNEIKKGWAVVFVRNKMGAINTTGVEILPPTYDKISDYDDENCHCFIVKKGDRQTKLDENGLELIPKNTELDFSNKTISARDKFINKLNLVLSTTSKMDWKFDGVMKVDTPFYVNNSGLLSFTVRYKTDSTFYRVRMEAPIGKITSIDLDIFLILFYKDNDVNVYISELGDERLIFRNKSQMIHVGEPRFSGNNEFLNEIRDLYKNKL